MADMTLQLTIANIFKTAWLGDNYLLVPYSDGDVDIESICSFFTTLATETELSVAEYELTLSPSGGTTTLARSWFFSNSIRGESVGFYFTIRGELADMQTWYTGEFSTALSNAEAVVGEGTVFIDYLSYY